MQPEFGDIIRFLLDCPPFDQLDGEQRQWIAGQIKAAYVNEHNVDSFFKSYSPALYIVRSGGFDLFTPEGQLIERLESHDLFGFPSLLSGRDVVNRLEVIEDGIIYIIAGADFDKLRQHSRAFERYFIRAHEQRLLTETQHQRRPGGAVSTATTPSYADSLQLPIAEVVKRAAVCLPSTATIQQAAQTMREEKISSVMIVDEGRLLGIVTDRDLRNRVVAQGLDYGIHVNAIMTQAPTTVGSHQRLLDALTLMTQENVHHIPVLDANDQPLGMLTNTDLMRQQKSEPVMLISALNKAADLASLVSEASHIPDYMHSFALRVNDAGAVGRLLASLTDTMTRKLIDFYEQEHGVAPASYVWLAFGSQGREDQTLSSDQDNGLLLANDLNEQQLQWFAGLGDYVCEGLAACGVPKCPGNIMASNPDCRRTREGWLERFTTWTESPTPKALMYCQIFFDSRNVRGNKRLYQSYREAVAKLGRSEFFLGNLARLQSNVQVPLGLFNRFRGTESGKDSDLIDIKRYGLALVNDIVRLYSLHAGLTEPRTLTRLALLQDSKLLNRKDNQALGEAWQFLTQLRLQHQLAVWGTDQPKNALDPDELSTLVRRQLKTAFSILKDCQQGVGMKFGRIG
jgi:CBS domain-containing protein